MTISLPLAAESMRCMDFALANQLDPGGTALAPDVVVLIEVDEPWPKPVGKHEVLVDLVHASQEWPEQIRLLAAVPQGDDPRRIIAFRPTATGMTRTEKMLCADPVGALRAALNGESGDGVEELATSNGVTTMLVCTQGSHDICCGEDGAAFAQWAEANADQLGGVEIFRVSHTGGHRFAPTAMTLPDGRMWAYLDAESASQIVDSRGDAAAVVGQCRGWWGAPTGPAQIGERAVFAQLGFAVDELERSVEVRDMDGRYAVAVTVGADVFEVGVQVGREVPTIACGAPGGLPAKPGREWTVTSGPTKR